jgi:prepilin-type processing-associated H-X9-DG protein
MTQFIKRGTTEWANIGYDSGQRKFIVTSKTFSGTPDLTQVSGFAWPTMLLSRMERSDIWDQIVSPARKSGGGAEDVFIPPIEAYVCPDDRDVTTQPDLAGLTYVANSGGWDPHGNGSGAALIVNSNVGDTADNGVFADQAGYERLTPPQKAPKTRMSNINDGAGTTLMYSENIHKSYDSTDPSGAPAFSWLFGSEQQLGFVWVNPSNGLTAPVQPVGISDRDQEAISRDTAQVPLTPQYPATIPRYARPASAHSGGVNVAFCDGHGDFLRDDIDYKVYHQLLTANGRKCVDPSAHDKDTAPGGSIYLFRIGPPLAEKDYK